jgi:hypothetical protein
VTINGPFPLQPADVIATVAAAYGLKPRDLTIPGRAGRPVEAARRVVYLMLREDCWLSWARVAEIMGRTKSGWVSRAAQGADPDAVARLRSVLHPEGVQGRLFG